MTSDKPLLLVRCKHNIQLFIKTCNLEKKQADLLYQKKNKNFKKDIAKNKAKDKTKDETKDIIYDLQHKDTMHKIFNNA